MEVRLICMEQITIPVIEVVMAVVVVVVTEAAAVAAAAEDEEVATAAMGDQDLTECDYSVVTVTNFKLNSLISLLPTQTAVKKCIS